MDAIALLKKDHATVKGLFAQVEALGDRADASRKKLFEKIDEALTVHANIVEHHVKEEETTLFKMARELFEKDELNKLGEQLEAAQAKNLALA